MERGSSGSSAQGSKCAVHRWLHQRVPMLTWRHNYTRTDAVADLVAGLTLGLTLVPQSIAYAALADLPVQYGLYSAFIGTILYVFLGTVKEVSIGPTSLMALMTLQTCRGLPIEFVVLLAFVSGSVILLMGLLKLGFLVEFISPSVTSGFTSGTAVLIVVSQMKGLLGLSFVAETVTENLTLIAQHLTQVRMPDCALAAACCTTLLTLRKLKDLPVSPKRNKLKKALWLISIARNAIVVCIASTVAYCLHDPKKHVFKLSGRVEPGLPPLSLPPFSVTMDNTTLNVVDMVQRMSPGVFLMPIIMVLANIAIAKAFTSGGRVDATQEMITLGLCNMAGSLFHAMPTCGAFTRSAVSHSSGVRTPAAGLYSGIITLMALKFMTQYFYFIPKACLSSVLICAVIFMIDYEILGKLWRRSKSELAVAIITFLVSVIFSVEMALLVGAITSLVVFIRRVMHPQINSQYDKVGSTEVLVINCAPVFVYMNAETLAEKIFKLSVRARQPVLLDCSNVALVDYTASQVMEKLVKKLRDKDQKLILFNATAEALNNFENLNGINKKALKTNTVAEAFVVDAKSMELDETANLLSTENNVQKGCV